MREKASEDSSAREFHFALTRCGSPDPVDDGKKKNGPKEGNQQARGAEVALIDGRDADQGAHQPPRKECANNPYNYIERETPASSSNRACCPTNQPTGHEPKDDIHHESF